MKNIKALALIMATISVFAMEKETAYPYGADNLAWKKLDNNLFLRKTPKGPEACEILNVSRSLCTEKKVPIK